MHLNDIKLNLAESGFICLEKAGITDLRPSQEKAINAGLFEEKSLLVCTPTASGKTLVAELGAIHHILTKKQKVVYIVPLKALATEKFRHFKNRYGHLFKVAMSIGDTDSSEPFLAEYDLIICTAEKFDSLLRHHIPWLTSVSCVILDEVHLINDPGRGPTVEVIITILKHLQSNIQIIGLSATIGNPQLFADWLGAELVYDQWRPVELKHGVYHNGQINFVK